MSLLIVFQWEDWVELVADTLVVRGDDDTPSMYYPKVYPIPQLNMVMAATGTAEVAGALLAFIVNSPGLRDINDVDAIAPEKLREFRDQVAETYGDAETSTIYLYGFPEGSDKVLSCTYTTMRGGDFESERFQGNKFMVKPGPQTFTADVPYEPEDRIALAYRLREEQRQLREQGEKSVAIGGELLAFRLHKDGIERSVWHRFPDYDESLPSFV